MNRRQQNRREHVREWGRCGRPFVTHLLNDDKNAPWCGKRFDASNKIAADENSVTCNDCQRLAAKPVYDRNRAAKPKRERARRVPFKQGFETSAQIEARPSPRLTVLNPKPWTETVLETEHLAL